LLLLAFSVLSNVASAQKIKVKGIIKERSGASMILQTADSPKLIVLLTDTTEVGQVQGLLKARSKEMSMAALIPGLAVDVEGTYGANNQLVASSVKFKGNDLKQAQAIQAGMHETQVQTQQNQVELEKQNAALQEQNQELQQQQQQLAQHQEKLAANQAAIDAAIARFGQMDDYYIFDQITVYFANAKSNVDPKYNSQLLGLADKAKAINGYMIQVEGYASPVGNAAFNQRLSEDRAKNVTNFLIQQGRIPLTNMLAPGAMGESGEVNSSADKSAEAQAENRRVVVRVLQNKGIAGVSAGQQAH
jgi:outer membrane protein OmpA-like peptidoglycan-associated protein